MKIKLLILGLGASILGGCNDELNLVGPSIQPGDDSIAVYLDTFHIQASTVQLESVYARSTSAQLGELYDPLYGNLKSDYLCQVYCPSGFKFTHTPIDGKIDSVMFDLVYADPSSSTSASYKKNGIWTGDSLAPMRAELFMVTKPLEKNFYTNIDPNIYCDMQKPMGAQAYTAYNLDIPDSIRNTSIYQPTIRIKMPKEFGQKFYDETVNNPATFNSQESFNEFFPGLYVTNTFGSGNILSISSSGFRIYYKYMTKGTSGKDTTINTWEPFTVTKEIIQLNRFKNTNMDELLQPNNDHTFFKTPAGVCTRIVIPSKEIAPTVEGRIINNMPLALKAMPQENWKYALDPPSYLLILPEDSVKTFFEKGQVENHQTSFLSNAYDATTLTYNFGNIANLLKNQLDKDPGNDLRLLVIPVVRTVQTNASGAAATSAISNYMAPSGVKIRKDEEVMKVGITSSKYAK